MKLTIYHEGDTSTGTPCEYFSVECPFEKNEVSAQVMEEFRHEILMIYQDFTDFRLFSLYDFEETND